MELCIWVKVLIVNAQYGYNIFQTYFPKLHDLVPSTIYI